MVGGGTQTDAGAERSVITKAFILGAGLGNRLRPLTNRLPKPLVPLFHKPLAEWAMMACARAGIREFAINTHHLPEAWENFGQASPAQTPSVIAGNGLPSTNREWRDLPVSLFHEPILLETGGGVKNIEAWIGGGDLLVHNGDIFSTLPLGKLIAAHQASGMKVTLALRSTGVAKHIAVNEACSRVTDIRNSLGRGEGTHVFSGIYCVAAGFTDMLPTGEKISVIPSFLELAKAGQLGAIVLDEGDWLDLGDRESYLQAHRELALGAAIHPDALVDPSASISRSVIGPGARVGPGASIRDSVIWPGGLVAENASLQGCIVFSGTPVHGQHLNADL